MLRERRAIVIDPTKKFYPKVNNLQAFSESTSREDNVKLRD